MTQDLEMTSNSVAPFGEEVQEVTHDMEMNFIEVAPVGQEAPAREIQGVTRDLEMVASVGKEATAREIQGVTHDLEMISNKVAHGSKDSRGDVRLGDELQQRRPARQGDHGPRVAGFLVR